MAQFTLSVPTTAAPNCGGNSTYFLSGSNEISSNCILGFIVSNEYINSLLLFGDIFITSNLPNKISNLSTDSAGAVNGFFVLRIFLISLILILLLKGPYLTFKNSPSTL